MQFFLMLSRYRLQDSIRKQVEKDFENRDAGRLLKNDSFESQYATKHVDHRDKYNHMHPHVTPEYIKSYYVDAGMNNFKYFVLHVISQKM